MNGYKTIIAAVVSVLMGVATMMGVTLDAQTMADIAANLELVIGGIITTYGLVMGVFRAVTSSPMFNGKKPSSGAMNAMIPLFAVLLVVGVQACSVQPRIQSPEDQVAVAYATINALTNATKKAYTEKRITRERKDEIALDLREVYMATKVAQDLIVIGKPEDGIQGLLVVNRLLLQLEKRLQPDR